ncbi:MAG: lipopolysaccharide heptosyltransferase family protein, partial [Pseudomonadota bacterium]
IKVRRLSGFGTAACTVETQLPLISPDFPEIQNCHRGTINLELETPLIVALPDHRTKPIKWKAALKTGEIFDFVRIELEVPYGGARHPAWLYIAHNSQHRKNLRVHEVIAAHIDFGNHQILGVAIKRNCKYLPYRENPLFVVV